MGMGSGTSFIEDRMPEVYGVICGGGEASIYEVDRNSRKIRVSCVMIDDGSEISTEYYTMRSHFSKMTSSLNERREVMC